MHSLSKECQIHQIKFSTLIFAKLKMSQPSAKEMLAVSKGSSAKANNYHNKNDQPTQTSRQQQYSAQSIFAPKINETKHQQNNEQKKKKK